MKKLHTQKVNNHVKQTGCGLSVANQMPKRTNSNN